MIFSKCSSRRRPRPRFFTGPTPRDSEELFRTQPLLGRSHGRPHDFSGLHDARNGIWWRAVEGGGMKEVRGTGKNLPATAADAPRWVFLNVKIPFLVPRIWWRSWTWCPWLSVYSSLAAVKVYAVRSFLATSPILPTKTHGRLQLFLSVHGPAS